MATCLHKPVARSIVLNGRDWVITLLPSTPERRYDAVSFRPRGCRKGGPAEYVVPVESALNHAAERTRQLRISEKKRQKKFGQV